MEKIDLDKQFEITPREMSDFGSKAMVALMQSDFKKYAECFLECMDVFALAVRIMYEEKKENKEDNQNGSKQFIDEGKSEDGAHRVSDAGRGKKSD